MSIFDKPLWPNLRAWLSPGLDEVDPFFVCDIAHIFRHEDPTGEGWSWQCQIHPLYDQMRMRNGISGKFVHHDMPERLAELSLQLRCVIAQGLSPASKYRPVLNDPDGPFRNLLPPLCIYSSDRHKEALYRALVRHGLRDIYWQSNEATRALHASLRKK